MNRASATQMRAAPPTATTSLPEKTTGLIVNWKLSGVLKVWCAAAVAQDEFDGGQNSNGTRAENPPRNWARPSVATIRISRELRRKCRGKRLMTAPMMSDGDEAHQDRQEEVEVVGDFELDGQDGGQHADLGLREVDDPVGPVDEHDADGEQGVGRAVDDAQEHHPERHALGQDGVEDGPQGDGAERPGDRSADHGQAIQHRATPGRGPAVVARDQRCCLHQAAPVTSCCTELPAAIAQGNLTIAPGRVNALAPSDSLVPLQRTVSSGYRSVTAG